MYLENKDAVKDKENLYQFLTDRDIVLIIKHVVHIVLKHLCITF